MNYNILSEKAEALCDKYPIVIPFFLVVFSFLDIFQFNSDNKSSGGQK